MPILYRGTSQKLDTHSLDKADPAALFGPGIYLTDSKRIAGDYKAKGGKVVFRSSSYKSKAEAIEGYLALEARFIDDDGTPLGFGQTNGNWKTRDQRIEIARQKWEKEKSKYIIRKLGDGDTVIQEVDKTGHLQKFNIPDEWIQKTLDVESEIPEDVLDSLISLIRSVIGRDASNGFSNAIYGYANSDEGMGYNPSYREIYRMIGPYIVEFPEFHIRWRNQLKELGYKGLHYAGGVTMGGAKHNAYVFWDEQGLKRSMIESITTKNSRDIFESFVKKLNPEIGLHETIMLGYDAIVDSF